MRRRLFIIVFILMMGGTSHSSEIRGRVIDAATNEPLLAVNISLSGTHRGTTSDSLGRFLLSEIEPGDHTLEFSIVGYQSKRVTVVIPQDELAVYLKPSPIVTDPVVVTANKRRQLIEETPVSIEIMDAAEIEFRNSRTVDEALRYVPGVYFTESQVNIRGSSGYNRGVGSRVSLLVDGIPMITGDSGELVFESLPVAEIERIEVVKGSSSALYGSSALGGVINVITKAPLEQPVTRIRLYGGVYSEPSFRQWEWSPSARFLDGQTVSHSQMISDVGLTLLGSRAYDGGFRRNDLKKRYNAFTKIGYDLTPLQYLSTTLNYFYQDRGSFIYWRNVDSALVPPENQLDDKVVSKRFSWNMQYRNVLSDKVVVRGTGQWYRNNFTSIIENSSDESTSSDLRGEVQALWLPTANHSVAIGAELIGDWVRSDLFGNRNGKGWGLYFQDELRIVPDLLLTLGVRFDHRSIDTVNSGEGQWSPKVGVVFDAGLGLTFRGSYGKGFRAPAIGEAFTSFSISGIPVIPNPALKAERSDAFEIGMKAILLDVMLLDLALFRSDYFDMIEAGFTNLGIGRPAIQFDNVTRARIEGGEIAAKVGLWEGSLVLGLGYTYVSPQDLTRGASLQYRPRHILYFSSTSTIGDFTLGADFRFLSRYEEIDQELVDFGVVKDGDVRVPIYLVDARVRYDFSELNIPLKMILNFNNLLQYNYVEVIGNLGPPRTITLVVEASL